MDDTEIIIDVKADVGDALRNIQQLKKDNEELKKTIIEDKVALNELQQATKEAGGATAEEAAEMQRLTDNIEVNSAKVKINSQAINANTKVVESSVAQTRLAADSLAALRKKSAELTAEWQYLSKEQREGEVGQRIQAELKGVNETINESMLSVGNFKDNIGNYRSAITDVVADTSGFGKALKVVGIDINAVANGTQTAGDALGGMKNAAKGLGGALKGLAGNPFFVVIAAFLVVAQNVSAAIQRSEETSNALGVTLAKLRPITDAIGQAFDALAKVVVDGFSAALDALQTLVQYAARAVDAVTGLFGADSKLEESVRNAVETQADIVRAEQELEKAQRQFAIDEARTQAEIDELRLKSADKQKYTFEERRKYIEEAIQLEQALADKRTQLAEENLKLQQAEAARGENDAAANEALARAETEVIRARASNLRTERELQQQRQAFLEAERKEREAVAEAARKHAEATRKALEDIVTSSAKAIADIEAERAKIIAESEKSDIASAQLWRQTQTAIVNGQIAALEAAQELRRKERDYEAAEEVEYMQKLAKLRTELRRVELEEERADYDQKLQAVYDAEYLNEEARLNALEALQFAHDQKLAEIDASYQAQRVKAEEDANARIAAAQEEASQVQAQITEAKWKVTTQTLNVAKDALGQYASESKAAFEGQKAVSIATALINTYQAATEAYSAMASIPYVGPALGAAAAAAAVAAGMVQVNAIRQTKFGGGGSSASTSTPSSVSAAATAPAGTATAGARGYYAAGGLAAADTAAIGTNSVQVSPAAGGQMVTTDQLVAVVKNLPSPVVSVQDINSQQIERAQRVEVAANL